MTFQWLIEPIDPDELCGLDLDEEYDEEYIDFLDDVEVRLPELYAKKILGGDSEQYVVFQPSSVKIKQERKAVDALLKRTRDLRLLVILAQWEILAGELGGFTDALEGIAAMLGAFGSDVHPTLDGGANNRKMALESLTKSDTVLQPLQHVALSGADDVTYRLYQVATQAMTARLGEEGADASRILNDLGSSQEVDETHALLARIAQALHQISTLCKADSDSPFTPKFDGLMRMVADIQGLIRSARADLQVWTASDAEPETEADAPASEGDEQSGDVAVASNTETPTVSAAPLSNVAAADAIASQPEARATLSAVESYLTRNEPSSAALLLVTQARLLIGRPLIEALETLLPGEANNAVIDFGTGTGFALNMDKLRGLAAEGLAAGGNAQAEEQPTPTPPTLAHRADVAAHLRAAEDFFRRNEPTSPIPMLLVRARSYLDKDFEAIVADLIPKQVNEGN